MKKIVIILLLSIFPLLYCYSQNESVIQTGALLSIQPVEPCVVYLDGREIGIAPVFISDLSEKNKLIQLKGKKRYAEIEISFNPLKTDISFYKPVLGEYYGTITVDCNIKDAVMYIDGETVPNTEDWFINLSSEKHSVSMKCDGYIQESVEIDVPRLETVAVKIYLKPAIQISFAQAIPEDSLIIFRQGDKELEYSGSVQNAIYLSSGVWDCRIINQLFEPVEMTITVDGSPVTLAPELNFFKPKVNITQIDEDSTIYIGDTDVTASVENGVLEVPVGASELRILNEKYLPFYAEIKADDEKIIIISPEYKPDPEYVRRNNITAGSIIAGAGAALLTGGLLLSNNDFLTGISENYSTYSAFKYTSLGTGAAGLLLLIGGGLFGGLSAFSQ